MSRAKTGQRRALPSAPMTVQIMALLLAGLILAQVATLALTLLMPPQPPRRIGLGEIAASLQGRPVADTGGRPLVRSLEAAPPSLQSPGWQVSERAGADLAGILGVEPARVRVLFYAPPPFAGVAPPPGLRPPPPGLRPTRYERRERPAGLVLASFDLSGAFEVAQAGPPGGGMGGGFGGGMPGGGFPGAGPMGGGFPRGEGPAGVPIERGGLPRGERPDGVQRPEGGARPERGPVMSEPMTGSRIRRTIPQDGGQRVERGSIERAPVERGAAGQRPEGPVARPVLQGPASTRPDAIAPPPRMTGPPIDPFPRVPAEILIPAQPPVLVARPEPVRRAEPVRPLAQAQGPSTLEAPAAPATVEPAPRPTAPTGLALAAPAPARPAAAAPSPEAQALAALPGRPLPAPVSRGLFGLAPAPFVEGDFVAAYQVEPNLWATVQPKAELLTAWQKRVLLWFLVSFALVAPVGYLFARRLARPLTQFAAAAERLGRDPSAAAPATEGPAEVGRAARAFNQMQDRIRRYVEDRNGMIGAISHDLRTPLSRMRFRLERTPPDVREAMARDIDQMEAMITSVLTFMREDALAAHRQRVDLRSILEVVTDDAALGGGAVELEPGAPAEVEVDVLGVQRVFANLIDNALKYGQQARIRLFMDEGEAVTEIIDRGEGLGEEELERVFQPFYRSKTGQQNRNGVGLGLAVSRSTVRAHGGDIRLRRAPGSAGVGLVAEVRLPTVRSAA